jgi:hypothetical protein
MTAVPEPVRYPDSWRPPNAPEFPAEEPESGIEPLAMELHLSGMPDPEFDALMKRVAGHRGR